METEFEAIDIQALQRGDEAAFQGLLEQFGEKSLRIAFRFTGNLDDARDIVQETFIKVCSGIGSFRKETAFAPWFYRVLTNTCRDWKRNFFRRMRTSLPENDAFLKVHPAEPVEKDDALRSLIAQMPQKMKMIFILHYQEEFAMKEIAGIMDISVDTVRVQLMKGRQFIRTMYQKTMKESI